MLYCNKRQSTYNVTLTRVHEAIVAAEKQNYIFLCVCVCVCVCVFVCAHTRG